MQVIIHLSIYGPSSSVPGSRCWIQSPSPRSTAKRRRDKREAALTRIRKEVLYSFMSIQLTILILALCHFDSTGEASNQYSSTSFRFHHNSPSPVKPSKDQSISYRTIPIPRYRSTILAKPLPIHTSPHTPIIMSAAPASGAIPTTKATSNDKSTADATKDAKLAITLEEDDEFEDFPVESMLFP